MDDQEEVEALTKTLNSYYTYEEFAIKELILPRRRKWDSLTSDEKALLSWFPQYVSLLEHCIRQNGEFTRNLALKVCVDWGIEADPAKWSKANDFKDYDKVRGVLKQITREWSDELAVEREVSLSRYLDLLESRYPVLESRQHVKILIPGAGLGRLNFELVKRGFNVQGNEYSYHMLLASNYILNYSYSKNAHTIYPFIHGFSNQVNRKFQTRPVYFPDLHQNEELSQVQAKHPTVPVGDLMSIVSGSFIDLYGSSDISGSQHYSTSDDQVLNFRKANKHQFDIIITNFFIDTSSNVIEYLKTINHVLKRTGKWLNFGPLLWHFEDVEELTIITKHDDLTTVLAPVKGLELSRDDLLELMGHWFELELHESGIQSGYGNDSRAMGGWKYECEYWIATPNTK